MQTDEKRDYNFRNSNDVNNFINRMRDKRK